MILRVAAALSLALGLGLLLAFLGEVGKSPWSSAADRHLRAMKDRVAAPASYTPMTYDEFASLPAGLPLSGYAQLEARGVSMEGYVQLLTRVTDGDYALTLLPDAPSRIMTDSLPLVTELTPQWHRRDRNWRIDHLAPELRAYDWGVPRWPGGPRRVRLSGWLMYDYPHDPRTRGRHARPGDPIERRFTGWEIHPITRIELWDDSLAAFVDWPR